MKYVAINCVLVLLFFIRNTDSTCVLESDFGFSLNCAFKKSSLFRVRNLGGLKAHFGLGFSVGDELGFPESLGNVEGSKRRALNLRTGANSIGVLPASKQPVSSSSPLQKTQLQYSRPQALTMSRQMPSQLQMQQMQYNTQMMQRQQQFQNYNKRQMMQKSLMTQATSLPLGVPAFKPIPPRPDTSKVNEKYFKMNTLPPAQYYQGQNNQMTSSSTRLSRVPSAADQQQHQYQQAMLALQRQQQQLQSNAVLSFVPTPEVPAFQVMPSSVSRISADQPIYQVDNQVEYTPKIHAQAFTSFKQDPQMPEVDLKGHTVEELAIAANVTVEVIQEAIRNRQIQMLADQKKSYADAMLAQQQYIAHQEEKQQIPSTKAPTTLPSTTTPRTTTPLVTKKPVSKYAIAGGHKVMNAPKEYYPVGYDKNFDDNFVSKVDLPSTTFHCGDQKHFPGLYGDEDLGCMVFHVCALTDDGLIMKSFLCPESTLFDQTILKCNWWFYVDCKNSRGLYDSNLPVSKSYQLMKALSFFSSYKKNNNVNGTTTDDDGFDVEALKNSVNTNNINITSKRTDVEP